MSGWAAVPLLTLEGYLHQQAKYTRLNSKALVKSWLSNISRLFRVTSWKSDKSWNIHDKFKCKSSWSHFLCMRYPHRLLCHVHMHIPYQDLLNSKHSTNLLLPPSLHMRYCSLPSPVTHLLDRLSWHDGEEGLHHCPAMKGWVFYQFHIQGQHTWQPQLDTEPCSHFMTLSEFKHMRGFLHSKETETCSISYAQNWKFKDRVFLTVLDRPSNRSEHKYRESLDLVFKQLNTGFSHSYPDVKHTV